MRRALCAERRPGTLFTVVLFSLYRSLASQWASLFSANAPLPSKSSLLSESSLFTVDSPSSQEVLPLEQALLVHSGPSLFLIHESALFIVNPEVFIVAHYGPQRYPQAVQLHSLTHGHRRLQAFYTNQALDLRVP